MRTLALISGTVALLLGTLPAQAAPRALAVMEARAAGMDAATLGALHQQLQDAFGSALKGSDFQLVPAAELHGAMKDIPGCGPGTCDIQAARHCEAAAVVSVEAVCQQAECSLSMRMFETKQGTLLARALLSAGNVKDLQGQVSPTARALGGTLLQAHALARAERPYLLRSPQGAPVVLGMSAPAPAPRTAAVVSVPRVYRDAEQAGVAKVLHAATPAFNACYDGLLMKNKHAHGRMVVSVDVEPSGQVSGMRLEENELRNAEMERCVSARVQHLEFAPSPQPWQVRFPLVFVPARK